MSRLRNTIFWRAATVFYADTEQVYLTPPAIQKAALPSVEAEVLNLLASLEGYHNRKLNDLRRSFPQPLQPVRMLQLDLQDLDEPRADVDAGGLVTLDARVVEAAFAAGMVTLESKTNRGREVATLEAALKSNRSLLTEVGQMQGKPMIREILELATQSSNDPFGWFRAHRAYTAALWLDDLYYGTLSFVLAHEIGHVALNHLGDAAGRGAPECAMFQRRELEADRYAALLLSEFFMAKSVFSITTPTPDYFLQGSRGFVDRKKANGGAVTLTFIDPGELEGFAGFATFLNSGFERAGFRRNLDDGCSYPSNDERLKNANDALVSTIDVYSERAVKGYLSKKNLLLLGNSFIGTFRGFAGLAP